MADHENFKHQNHTLGEVPYKYDSGASVLCHHSLTCGYSPIVNDSESLVDSVYNWIKSGEWVWKHSIT